MNASAVIDIINLAIFIGKLIVEYGPPLYKMGVEIYEAVEEWASKKGKEEGQKPSSEAKAARFDTAAKKAFITAERIVPGPVAIEQYRQNIWLSRKDNWVKTPKEQRKFGLGVGVPKQ